MLPTSEHQINSKTTIFCFASFTLMLLLNQIHKTNDISNAYLQIQCKYTFKEQIQVCVL